MEKLLFVYNANSGRLNGLLDSLHKTLKPATYSCKLCSLTHGPLSERQAWKKFRENLEMDTEFYHRDEFEKAFASKFGNRFEYPVILVQTSQGLEMLLNRDELEEVGSLNELCQEIQERIKPGS